MIVQLLTEHHLEFLSLKGAAKACLSLHLSKCHIVGNVIHWLIFFTLALASLVLSASAAIARCINCGRRTSFLKW